MTFSRKIGQIATGAGRLLDFSRSYNRELERKYLRTDSAVLDRRALSSDWRQVEQDFAQAFNHLAEKNVAEKN